MRHGRRESGGEDSMEGERVEERIVWKERECVWYGRRESGGEDSIA